MTQLNERCLQSLMRECADISIHREQISDRLAEELRHLGDHDNERVRHFVEGACYAHRTLRTRSVAPRAVIERVLSERWQQWVLASLVLFCALCTGGIFYLLHLLESGQLK